MIKQEEMKVINQKEIAQSIYELTLEGELVSEMSQPGQFVHIKTGNGFEPLLRRPISISSINPGKKQFTMIYRAEGKGTELLSQKEIEKSVDVLGPMGNGFPLNEAAAGSDTVLLVGGGIGVPPLYELSKRLKEKGITATHVLGFQAKEHVFYEDEFTKLGETYIVTADGSYGSQGFVTDVIRDLPKDFTVIYACGPTPMLRALEIEYGHKKLFLSLEERMGCGIGACFACVCHTADDPTGSSYKKVCSDGPVFRSGEVVI
ncbi:dihydroorotate dehydrogenase electron transfer subunit [Peribacillus cavernae]|uniref:Dihydroorotate dehydrogenase B (NAD(+)), electron transfer subunit n=1 Tax=Peribacillus cavernae TaxID=1674310 RepID=A0A433HPY1_9BACI|nr:dihydroorotate dehydrogenase electron transfer subunit [Peribacillus cavernae]MDQ0217147.1 dihydroorotate dehydrogenase electron transfer subunit [Peribacillus cavernae]RUQ30379.1 dihydroorotate dehydrogenase electron transfer subunit [Peribacillus cavernae]